MGAIPRSTLAPEQRRQRTLEALTLQLAELARQQPVLMIFEDAHWIDPTSLEVFGRIVDRIKALPVLLIVTFRPEFDAPWVGQSHVTSLTLNRLGEREAAAIIARLAGNKALPADVLAEIVERTDGIPLFVEEMTKAVLEAESEGAARRTAAAVPSPALAVPASLHASLMARLDRLGPAKEVAQVGAVIGRQFSYALLAAVADRDESELHTLLDQLVAAGLVFREAAGPHAMFRFKHALVQSVAYESLLRSARQQLHARIAATLEAAFLETEPEQLAQHWAQAGDAGRAVSNWRKAGKQAIQRGANREAIAQLTKGLRMLERLPHGLERDRIELGLQLLLAEALMADKGWTAPETRPCYDRARELCGRIGDSDGLLPVLYGQFSHHLSRGEADAAHGLALQTLQLTEGSEDAALRSMAHSMLGMSLFSRGELGPALAHLRTALSLHQADRGSHTFLSPGHNFAIASLWVALTLLLLGHPEQASLHVAAGLRAAGDLSNPHTLAHALALACRFYSALGETGALHQATEELAALAAEHRFPFYVAAAQIYRGWVHSAHDVGHGIETLREGMAAFMDLGSIALRPYFCARIAVLSAASALAPDALVLLDEAQEQVDQSGQRWCEAEVHRSRGELLSGLSDTPQAESCFQRSLVTARRARRQAMGTAGRLQSCPALARPGQTARGTRSPSADLWVVHRGLRHSRSEGGQGLARQAAAMMTHMLACNVRSWPIASFRCAPLRLGSFEGRELVGDRATALIEDICCGSPDASPPTGACRHCHPCTTTGACRPEKPRHPTCLTAKMPATPRDWFPNRGASCR